MTTALRAADKTPRSRLERALDFTPSDLEANRQGRVSDRQREAIRRHMAKTRRMVNSFHRFVGIVSAAMVIGVIATADVPVPSGSVLILPIGGLLLTVANFLFHQRKLYSEDHLNEVFMTEGPVEAYAVEFNEDDELDEQELEHAEPLFGGDIMVGAFHAEVTKAQFEAFEPERPYRLYYLDWHGANYLLSAEVAS